MIDPAERYNGNNNNNAAITTDFDRINGRNKLSVWGGLQEHESVEDTPSKN